MVEVNVRWVFPIAPQDPVFTLLWLIFMDCINLLLYSVFSIWGQPLGGTERQ